MGEVKRYDLEQGSGYDTGGALMVEHLQGDYVRFDDYAALERKPETVLEALKVAYEGLTEYQSSDEFDEKVQIIFAAISAAQEREG